MLPPLFFFFQAEDGIRDLTVTGVQTCALPISSRANSTESLCCAIRASDRVRHAATHRSATSAPIRMGGNIFHRLEQRSTAVFGPAQLGAASSVAAFSRSSEVKSNQSPIHRSPRKTPPRSKDARHAADHDDVFD